MKLEERRKSPELDVMRTLLLSGLLLLSACRQEEDAAANQPTGQADSPRFDVYQAGGRDRLCIGKGRAAFIVYAEQGDSNCSVSGAVERSGSQITIRPDGDTSCTITAVDNGTSLRLGPLTPACAYYCGPNASFAERTFDAMPGSQPVTDLAGEPLC
jgi:hypothetical protein